MLKNKLNKTISIPNIMIALLFIIGIKLFAILYQFHFQSLTHQVRT